MSFPVLLTDDAARDLEDLCDYLDLHDDPYKADYVLEQIERHAVACPKNLTAELTPRNYYL